MAATHTTTDGAVMSLRLTETQRERTRRSASSKPIVTKPADASQKASTAYKSIEEEQRALRQVRSLFLSCRNIVFIGHIQHLPEMTGLRSLSLHMNLVRRIEGLETLRHLVELDLSGNEIRKLEPGCFRAQANLARLNLSSNYLTALPEGAFAFLPSLSWLSLAYNELTTVRQGLASIPRVAPLAYVDLCGNNIAPLAEVTEGLAAHREHLKELRLQTPQQLLSGVTSSEAAGTSAAQQGSPLVMFNPTATMPTVRENPLCEETFPRPDDPNGGRMNYVERVLQCFPRLVVLNGVAFGVDPLQVIQRHEAEQKARLAVERESSLRAEEQMREELEHQRQVIRLLQLRRAQEEEAEAAEEHHRQARRRNRQGRSREEEEGQAGAMDDGPLRQRAPPSARKLTFTGDASRSPPGPGDTSRSIHFVTPDRNDDEESTLAVGASAARKAESSKMDVTDNQEQAPAATAGSRKRVTSMTGNARGAHGTKPLLHGTREPTARHRSYSEEPSLHSASGNGLSPLEHKATRGTPGIKLEWPDQQASQGAKVESVNQSVALREAATQTGAPPPASHSTSSSRENEKSKTEERVRVLTQQLTQKEEQLRACANVEADLRRHAHTQDQRIVELETQKANQQQQLQARIAALKDEVLRRASEVSIMKKKERANLDAQATAIEAHWKETLAAQAAQWKGALDNKETAIAALTNRMQAAEAARTRLDADLQEWKQSYQELRLRCERAVTELDDVKDRHKKSFRHQEALFTSLSALADEEANERRRVEQDAGELWAAMTGALVARVCAENATQLEEWAQYRETWESYAQSLQAHYKDVLHHAEREAEALREQVEALKVVQGITQGKETQGPAVVRCDAACDALPLSEGRATAALVLDDAQMALANTKDPLYAATQYWRDAATKLQEEATRLRVALELSEATHTAVAEENKRLLARCAALTEKQSGEQEGWPAEKENLLRALHNLQEDLGKKDAALDALEEEARKKIGEKRRTIAELEERLEALTDVHERATEAKVSCREELDAAQRKLTEAEQKANHLQELSETQERQLSRLKEEVTHLREQLQQERQHQQAASATRSSAAERRSCEVEQARLISALTVAREQLVRLHQAHCEWTAERRQLTLSLEAKERELADVRLHLREVQESGKQKHRAAMEMLTRVMSLSDDG